MDITTELHTLLVNTIEQEMPEGVSFELPISLVRTENPVFGDFTTNAAMQAFKKLKTDIPGTSIHQQAVSAKTPQEYAQKIADRINTALPDYLLPVTVAGPGFINFTLSDSALRATLHSEEIATFHEDDPKKVIVEYSSPNIAKPFTIGHLRSTIIGDAVANLLETLGHTVYRDNHLGDWGTQFGKLIVAIKRWGDLNVIESAQHPVKELVQLYVKFHEEAETDPTLEDEARLWFTKLEQGDPEARKLWQQCIDWSWVEFDRIYEDLGVTFTENDGKGYGESFFEDKMEVVVQELADSTYLQEGKEGAKLFFFPNDEFPPLMILKKDGSTLYATRDLATDKFRLSHYGTDITVINEVGAEQELYFKQLYRVEELLGWYAKNQRVHVKHGHFRFKDQKMSTRKGNVIWLEEVIQEAKQRAQALSKDVSSEVVASQVAIGALKWNDLKRASHLDVVFDWEEILNMKGNSGPYLQYTAVRCQSILSKSEGRSEKSDPLIPEASFNPEERAVLRHLLYFTTTMKRAAGEYAPHYVCTYLFELAQAYNSFYNNHQIVGSGAEESKRIAITTAVKTVLEKGLQTLGIAVPRKM